MPENQSNNPLDQLPPLHLPDPISFWPPAIGWWVLAVLLVLTVIFFVYYFIKRKHKNRLKKAAVCELDLLWQSYKKDNDAEKYVVAANRLLKQFVLQQYPHKNFHTLSGDQWLIGLAELSPKSNFNPDSAAILLTIYEKEHDYVGNDVQALHALIAQWFKGLRITSC